MLFEHGFLQYLKWLKTGEIARIMLTHVCFIALTPGCLHDVTVVQESVVAETDHLTDAFVWEKVAGSYDIVSML